MKNKVKIGIWVLLACIVAACSTKKDAFLNRSYHAVSTKYNVLFNGDEALKTGLDDLNNNYEENYWEVLPIEPLKVDEMALPGIAASNENAPSYFDKAEEKAVKAVQKHSMLIDQEERNSQIDDAYLLLGKARYYSKRFVPALEAFNFVILNYPKANLIHETKIWQSKTLIRLQNEEQAIENLKALLKSADLKEEILEDAHTAMAMAYESLGQTDQVMDHLRKAVIYENNIEQTARNLFVLGQMYSLKNDSKSAYSHFQNIIDLKKAPYKYKIHASIEKAKNALSLEDKLSAKEELLSLVKERENRPYLDELYYHLGLLEEKKNDSLALEYYNSSLQANTAGNQQKELTYEAVGNLYFDKASFLTAGAYYDSILQIAQNRDSKRIRRLIRKRSNLNEVILYENIAKTNDSILALVAMSDDEQGIFFAKHIEGLKLVEARKQANEKQTGGFFSFGNRTSQQDNNSGKWYFYNVQTVGFGAQEFTRIWGNRPLEDNWRLSDKTVFNFGNTSSNDTAETISFDDTRKYELDYYIDRIPKDDEKITILVNDRNNAYYKLGLIYKEQFKELQLAENKLKRLLEFNPDISLKIPGTYHLYKIYETVGNAEEAARLKDKIISEYTDSKYAQIILNPANVIEDAGKNSPEAEYATVFYEYKAEKFESVIERASLAIGKYEGQVIVPKFELLRAYAIGKKDGIEAFKTALDFVAMNYPNTEEAAKALEVIETIKSKI